MENDVSQKDQRLTFSRIPVVVLQLWNRTGRGCDNSNESGFRSKHSNSEAMEQTDLRTHCTPARLAFADHINRLVTGGRAPSSPEGAKMLTRAHPAPLLPMLGGARQRLRHSREQFLVTKRF